MDTMAGVPLFGEVYAPQTVSLAATVACLCSPVSVVIDSAHGRDAVMLFLFLRSDHAQSLAAAQASTRAMKHLYQLQVHF